MKRNHTLRDFLKNEAKEGDFVTIKVGEWKYKKYFVDENIMDAINDLTLDTQITNMTSKHIHDKVGAENIDFDEWEIELDPDDWRMLFY